MMGILQPRYIGSLCCINLIMCIHSFYKEGHWAYIPPMIVMTLFIMFCCWYDWKRDKERNEEDKSI